jgi:diamine N-acetyltransferase
MNFEVCGNCSEFFKILPLDWLESILPHWETINETTKGYLLVENQKIISGGLVFSKCPPDMLYAIDEANHWIKNGYLYLGFIYVIEERRHQNLGSIWLNSLKQMHPNQKYWLTIEDLKLDTFYKKNDFKKVKTLFNDNQEEWLYVFEPKRIS